VSYWAKIENNVVVNVLVGDDSFPDRGESFIKALGGMWLETVTDKSLRKNYASIGYTYDSTRDAFIPPKPFESWVLNEDTCQWTPPTPRPTDGKIYEWDEPTKAWVEQKV